MMRPAVPALITLIGFLLVLAPAPAQEPASGRNRREAEEGLAGGRLYRLGGLGKPLRSHRRR